MTYRLLAASLLALAITAGPGFAQAPTPGPLGGQHPRGLHIDNNTDGPAPHNPAGSANRAEGGGPAAHIDNEPGGTPQPHRPGARPSPAGGVGAPAHMDNQPGDSPSPHRPGRGPN